MRDKLIRLKLVTRIPHGQSFSHSPIAPQKKKSRIRVTIRAFQRLSPEAAYQTMNPKIATEITICENLNKIGFVIRPDAPCESVESGKLGPIMRTIRVRSFHRRVK